MDRATALPPSHPASLRAAVAVAAADAAATKGNMSVFFITLLLLATSYFVQCGEAPKTQAKSGNSAEAMVVPICSVPGPQLRRIGSKFGLQFDVPKREVEVLGGKPDVDYVRYVIKPKTGQGYLELWFGPYAFNSNPEKELLSKSVSSQKRDVVGTSGEPMGTDSSGKLQTGEFWRHAFFLISGMNGARFKAGQENTPLFNRIIDSACYVPDSKR
jgi:hypothetical protein